MIINFPWPGDRYDAAHARQMVEELQRGFTRVLSTETSAPYLLLTSPDQSVWKVTISDLGALAAVKLPKGRPIA